MKNLIIASTVIIICLLLVYREYAERTINNYKSITAIQCETINTYERAISNYKDALQRTDIIIKHMTETYIKKEV